MHHLVDKTLPSLYSKFLNKINRLRLKLIIGELSVKIAIEKVKNNLGKATELERKQSRSKAKLKELYKQNGT